MSKSKIDLILYAKCKDGKLVYSNPVDYHAWCMQYDDRDVMVSVSLTSNYSEKQRMFAYLHGPLMDSIHSCMDSAGYSLSKKDAFVCMKSMFAKRLVFNPFTGENVETYEDFSSNSTPKESLLKFINDIIQFLEESLGGKAPDSDTYKNMKATGRLFKSAKKLKYEDGK
jgi:hypothetical protein